MRVLNFEQGTSEWMEWRDRVASASDAAVIMGVAPSYWGVRTWGDMRARDVGLTDPPGPQAEQAFAHGHRFEPDARELLRERLDLAGLAPVSLEMENGHCAFGASLDGWERAESSTEWVEIKCPYRRRASRTWREAEEGIIPPHYRWQMVHQAGVIASGGDDLGNAHYAVYVPPDGDDDAEIRITTIPGSELLADWPKLRDRWESYMRFEPDGRQDGEWEKAAEDWLVARHQYDAWKEAQAEAAENLRALAGPAGDYGAGVSVVPLEVRGAVDWKAVSEHLWCEAGHSGSFTAYAETFRKPSSIRSQIREDRR